MRPARPGMPERSVSRAPARRWETDKPCSLQAPGDCVPERDVSGSEKERKAQEKGKNGKRRRNTGAVPDLPPFQDIVRDDAARAADPRRPAPRPGGEARLFGRSDIQKREDDHPRAEEQDGPYRTHPRHRDEEEDVPVADPCRPPDRGGKPA